MTTITLEVSDDLAVRLQPLRERLPKLLERTLEALQFDSSPPQPVQTAQPMHTEVLDFMASSPTPKQILEFKVSAPLQERVDDLLDKNHEAGLTPPERAEMETYLQISHFMTMLKARAHQALRDVSNGSSA